MHYSITINHSTNKDFTSQRHQHIYIYVYIFMKADRAYFFCMNSMYGILASNHMLLFLKCEPYLICTIMISFEFIYSSNRHIISYKPNNHIWYIIFFIIYYINFHKKKSTDCPTLLLIIIFGKHIIIIMEILMINPFSVFS